MATSEQVQALIRSHIRGEHDRFVAVSRQIAAHEEGKGHHAISSSILRILSSRQLEPTRVELGGLLARYEPDRGIEDLVGDAVKRKLQRILEEQSKRDLLEARGLSPKRKLLLVGPPGSGKTMTAGVLAKELDLPMWLVPLEALIESHMGETARNVKKVFDHVRSHVGVYLFDEFDAIGADRSIAGDGAGASAETRRIVSSLLVLLEQDRSNGFILATTNQVGLLDGAMFRRFDDIIRYSAPTGSDVEIFLDTLSNRMEMKISDRSRVDVPPGSSYASIEAAFLDAARSSVLGGVEDISVADFNRSLRERDSPSRPSNRAQA